MTTALLLDQEEVLVLDLGGANLRVGTSSRPPRSATPNQVVKSKSERRKFVGEELGSCVDTSSLFYQRPFEKGYLVNWEVQKEVLDRALGPHGLQLQANDHEVLVTQPLFNPLELQDVMFEVLFEEYGFRSVCCPSSQLLSMIQHVKETRAGTAQLQESNEDVAHKPCTLLVDCGYSATHVVPFFGQHKINHAIKRINVGGKALTNYLKEIVSFRAWNMMEETFLMNVVKERLCFVSLQFMKDMQATRDPLNSIKRHYVLPDYTTTDRGWVVKEGSPIPEDKQILVMNNERIVIPEILFHPSDIGIDQAGIAETILQSIEAAHEDIRPHLYGNIVLTGGSALFPNFQQRVLQDVRALAPEGVVVRITTLEDPIMGAWQGGTLFVDQDRYQKTKLSRHQYEEHGSAIGHARFAHL